MAKAKPQRTIECRDKAEFDRLPMQTVADAFKIIVGGVVVKNRNGPVGGRA